MSRTAEGRTFLRAAWRNLVMLNYEVDAAVLEPLVPAGVQLDRWRDRVFVSVVGFLFQDTTLLGLPVPGHRTFEEVNLRFYVRREVPDGARRGVVFVRELVPRVAIAAVARLVYNEPYRALPMRHDVAMLDGDVTRWRYGWRTRAGWTSIVADTVGSARPLEPGSEAEFITEHYWGYTRQRDGGTIEYRVDHPPWNVWTAERAAIEGDVTPVYGETFARVVGRPPASAFVAEGSPVTVFRGRRMR